MSEIVVDFHALENGEASLRQAVDEIGAHLDELEHTVTRLLHTWSGEAAEAFRAAHQGWDAAVAEMYDTLDQIHDLIVTAHGHHAKAVRSNTAIWQV